MEKRKYRQNKELTKKLGDAQRQIDELKSENVALSDRSKRDWFLIGAGVLAIGLLLGLLVPHLGWQRKQKIPLP